MNLFKVVVVLAVIIPGISFGENLVLNGSFEERDKVVSRYPEHWKTHMNKFEPLGFSDDHHDGAASVVIVGDGKNRAFRQIITDTKGVTNFELAAYIKAENVFFAKGESATIYCHILYKDQPYSQATHFYWKIRPGSYGWLRVSVRGHAISKYKIAYLYVTVGGTFSRGKILVDQVSLQKYVPSTPREMLKNKITDLQSKLTRIGNLDSTIPVALDHLSTALEKLHALPNDLQIARSYWQSAAEQLSHKAWAAMYPEAMTEKKVEARMVYHGLGFTREKCDSNLRKIEAMGCNAVLLSLGSWNGVVYKSKYLPLLKRSSDFDALKYFIAQAHKRNIKVFAYLAVFVSCSQPNMGANSIAKKHPEWLAKSRYVQASTFLDPANPEAVNFMKAVFVELISKYALDGVGLDYIRYPERNSLNYDSYNQEQILQRYSIDIFEKQPDKDPVKWGKINQYRREQITNAVRVFHDGIKRIRPEIKIIAPLLSDPGWAIGYAQDWPVFSKWLDYATPMNYGQTGLNVNLLKTQRKLLAQNHTFFVPAIGGMPHIHERWTISTWARYVITQRKAGCDGIIIYRFGEFDPAVAAFFGNGVFNAKVEFPLRSK